MIHGFSSSPDELAGLGSFLAEKGYTVSAPLLAGHGSTPEEMLQTGARDWVQSAREAYLQLRQKCKKVFLLGNSFGADVAFWLAREFNNEQLGIVTLGAPIFLKYHRFILLRLYTYGIFQKFYKKPNRLYRNTGMQPAYQRIPTNGVRDFLRFVKFAVRPGLEKVTIPALIIHSKKDPVVHPKSADYIFNHLGSDLKNIHWLKTKMHNSVEDKNHDEIFERILRFISELDNRLNG